MKYYAKNQSDTSTGIRKRVSDLKLAFKFKNIPNNYKSANGISAIGFVPQGSFHEKGWSGAVQIFEYKPIGVCAYAQRNVKASHTAAELAIEGVTYEVNNKVSLKIVRGNEKSGFDYKIEWFDNDNFHELECANMKYSAQITKSVVALANQIDSYQ